MPRGRAVVRGRRISRGRGIGIGLEPPARRANNENGGTRMPRRGVVGRGRGISRGIGGVRGRGHGVGRVGGRGTQIVQPRREHAAAIVNEVMHRAMEPVS